MKIIFTGATSFTGHIFVEALAQAGHEVYCPLRSPVESYTSLRLARLKKIEPLCRIVGNAPFGSPAFFQFLEDIPQIDLFCHHASDVTNYKSADFDPLFALGHNCHEARKILAQIAKKGASSFILTGSVFEPGEGAGSEGLPPVSPYGLSKGMTASFYSYYVPRHGLQFKKFVIPNPFGPLEELRFTSFVARTWLDGKKAQVTHPRYVRDNIPSTLLKEAYLRFLTSPESKMNPSGWAEMQGSFALRFQKAMKERLNCACEMELLEQVDFSEPKVRINTDLCLFPFDEKAFWDDLAEFYLKTYSSKGL